MMKFNVYVKEWRKPSSGPTEVNQNVKTIGEW